MVVVNRKENPREHADGAALFYRTYEQISRQLPYEPTWREGTPNFPGILKHPVFTALAIAEMVRFVDDQGRKAIVVGTDHGPCVIFQRYRNSPHAFKLNGPEQVLAQDRRFLGFLGIAQMEKLLLHPDQL